MRALSAFNQLATALALLYTAAAVPVSQQAHLEKRHGPLCPKVFIIDMFSYEGNVWYGIPEFDLLAQNISVPGLSPLYPDVHCTADGQICQIVTGEAEINAATSVASLVFSGYFDLTKTYFMIAGIAGVNPKVGTLGSVAFAKYAVQVALQYEFDAREIPANFSTGYVPFGAVLPQQYPTTIYGTEVFELNEPLRDAAIAFASAATLNDSDTAVTYRALYAPVAAYAAAAASPSVLASDVVTSDVYFSGNLLSEAFENTTISWTNGSGVYCMTAEEDNGSLEVLTRATVQNLTDFRRIILMRTASDFDRPPPGISDIDNLLYIDQGGFGPALENIYLTGVKVVLGIIDNWDGVFEAGITPTNYIGDILATLGGTPDFGYPPAFITKRDVRQRKRVKAPARY